MLPTYLRSPKRLTIAITAVIFFALFLGLLSSPARHSRVLRPWASDVGIVTGSKPPSKSPWTEKPQREMHILLPATKSNVNFCKTLLTMAIMGYPTPEIVAWGDDDHSDGLVGGGSHYAKITRVLEYINEPERTARPEFEDELIFMLDSYDIWFQLPIHTLIDRYDTMVEEENERVAHRMGRAYDNEDIRSEVVFGGGKRCAPNQLQTYACYPVPESPLPYDIRDGATDTILGRTPWSSYRTRYLNSGYIIGPVRQLRPMLEVAVKKLEECIDRTGAPWDTGSGTTDKCYHGSDQSIFVEMFGEQEFHREVMRRHHRNAADDFLDKMIPNRAGSKPPKTHIQNAPISDMINPEFHHQEFDPTYLPGKPMDYGIMIDYWSTLGHQTANAEFDFRYVRHNEPIENQMERVGWWDCKGKAPMPQDLPEGSLEILGGHTPNSWETIPLYTEICVGTVPVMIHHNSVDKWQREAQWDRTWWHGKSRELLEKRRKEGHKMLTEGIQVEKGPKKTWEQLCPVNVEPELFRDISQEDADRQQEEVDRKKKEAKEKADQEKLEKEKAEQAKEDQKKPDPMDAEFFEDDKQPVHEDVEKDLPGNIGADEVSDETKKANKDGEKKKD